MNKLLFVLCILWSFLVIADPCSSLYQHRNTLDWKYGRGKVNKIPMCFGISAGYELAKYDMLSLSNNIEYSSPMRPTPVYAFRFQWDITPASALVINVRFKNNKLKVTHTDDYSSEVTSKIKKLIYAVNAIVDVKGTEIEMEHGISGTSEVNYYGKGGFQSVSFQPEYTDITLRWYNENYLGWKTKTADYVPLKYDKEYIWLKIKPALKVSIVDNTPALYKNDSGEEYFQIKRHVDGFIGVDLELPGWGLFYFKTSLMIGGSFYLPWETSIKVFDYNLGTNALYPTYGNLYVQVYWNGSIARKLGTGNQGFSKTFDVFNLVGIRAGYQW